MSYTLGTFVPLVGGGYAALHQRSGTLGGFPSIELVVQLYGANRQTIGEPVVVGRAFSDPHSGAFATTKGYDLAAAPLGGFMVVHIGVSSENAYSPTFSRQSVTVFDSGGKTVSSFGYDYAFDSPAPHLIPLVGGGVIVQQDWSLWVYDAQGNLQTQVATSGTPILHDLVTIVSGTTTRSDGTIDQLLIGLDGRIKSTAIVKTLTGTAGADKLVGSTGPDIISGGEGDDVITGGFGFDVLTGGAGADRFVFGLDGSVDRVTDFDPTQDKVQITDLQGGVLPAAPGGQLTFDGRSHVLYWDDDGAAGPRAPVVVAVLDGVDRLSLSNIIGVEPTMFVNLGFLGAYDVIGSGTLTGGAFADTLVGRDGNDTLNGGGGNDRLTGGGGSDAIDGGGGVDTAVYDGSAASFRITIDSTGWKVADLRTGRTADIDTLRDVELLAFTDKTLTLGTHALGVAVASVLRAQPGEASAQSLLSDLFPKVSSGQMTTAEVAAALAKAAVSTTSVASLNYEFFTGKIPSQIGIDYLVSATGPNANNLNSAYYAQFNTVNRYINFATNLGKNGEAKDSFAAAYGGLTLFEATRKAYGVIFGKEPNDAKVAQLLDGRVDFLARFSGDGPEGIGTKAAMVGFLLAAAATEDVGVMARTNDAWLADLADGSAPYAINILDPSNGYYRADFVFGG